MSIISVGIDLAKNVFAVHGGDATGTAVLVKPKVSREQLLPLLVQLPPCLIGMEACYATLRDAQPYGQPTTRLSKKIKRTAYSLAT